jgi:hypothetical protein
MKYNFYPLVEVLVPGGIRTQDPSVHYDKRAPLTTRPAEGSLAGMNFERCTHIRYTVHSKHFCFKSMKLCATRGHKGFKFSSKGNFAGLTSQPNFMNIWDGRFQFCQNVAYSNTIQNCTSWWAIYGEFEAQITLAFCRTASEKPGSHEKTQDFRPP